MFDFPPDTPWIYAWLGAAALLGLIIGWLLGRAGKGRLRQSAESARSEIDAASEARREAEEALEQSESQSAALQQQLDEARSSLGDADREIEGLRAEVDAAETRITQLEMEVGSATAATAGQVEDLRSQLAAAGEESESLRAALSAASSDTDVRVAAAEAEAEEALSRAAAIEEALSATKLERDNLRRSLDEARSTGVDDEELEELRGRVEEARREAEDLREEAQAATARADTAEAALEAAGQQADEAGAAQSELAARNQLVRELQERLDGLAGVEDRLKAREAEMGELRRSQGAVVAAKDAEIRSLKEKLEAIDRSAESQTIASDAELAAALEAAQAELATARERSEHWEKEAAGLRSSLAEASTTAAAEPAPAVPDAPVAPGTAGIEERLDRLQDLLADKEARIAYLADRVARLESNLGAAPRQPSPAPAPAPEATEPAPEPELEPIPEPEAEPDDLTALWGVGPAIAAKLNAVGISRYEQLALMTGEDRHRLGEILGDFLDRIEADDWPGQARRLIEDRGGTVPETPLAPIKLTPPPAKVEPDDLTAIKGIGPFIANTLNDMGINTFAQIAAWTPEEMDHYGEALVIFQDRITREDWVGQARRLLRGR